MGKSWIAINLVLVTLTGLLAWQLKNSVGRFNAQNNIGKIQPIQDLKQKLALEGGAPPPLLRKPYNSAEFSIIPDQNVFSESRAKEEKTEAAPVAPVIAELVNKPVLVGITISGNQRLAAIIDPTVQGSPARRTRTKRVGDVYQGYTITDIGDDRMILEAGSRREIIPLHDGSKHQAQGGKTPILATRIVAFGGGAVGGGTTTPVQGTTAGRSAATRPTATPAQPIIGPAPAGTITAGSSTGIRTVPQGGQGGGNPASPNAAPQVPGANPPAGSRIIRTPFGDIVRPDVPPNQ